MAGGNILSDNGVRFFSMAIPIVELFSLRQASGAAVKLYVALMYLANKHTATRLELTNDEIRAWTGLDHKSVARAREELFHTLKPPLVRFEPGPANVWTYQLLNPDTGDDLLVRRKGYKGIKRHIPTRRNGAKYPGVTGDDDLIAMTSATTKAKPSGVAYCYACRGTDFRVVTGGEEVCNRCYPAENEHGIRIEF